MKTNRQKGQGSIELLVTVGVALVFLLPLSLFFLSSSTLRTGELSKMQAKALAQQIADEAGRVYYQGPWAKRTVMVNYPDMMLDITVNNTEVIVTMEGERGGENQFVAQAPSNMTDAISGGMRVERKALAAMRSGRYVNGGIVALVFRVSNDGKSVNIFRLYGGKYDIDG